jgi:yeast amino acid transporter
MVGLLVPYDDERLLGANPYVDTSASPIVIALNRAIIHGFPDVINVVILISVLSIGNSCVYGGSRTLTALAEQGYAPESSLMLIEPGAHWCPRFALFYLGLLHTST